MDAAAPLPLYDSRFRRRLRDLWHSRDLILRLVERNLKIKYQRSALGFVWTFFNPLLTVGILMTVFSYVVRIDVPRYWAFLLSGYFVFNFVLQMLNTASKVLPDHAQITKSAAFPSEVLILSATLARLVEFVVAIVLVVTALALLHHQGIPPSFVLLPLLIVLQLLLVAGVVMPMAVLSVFFYDVEHALPVLIMMLFYVSPVFYPASFVPEAFAGVYFLNPLAGLLTLYHQVLYEGRFPSLQLLLAMTAAALAVFYIGYAIFRRYQAVCAEIV